MSITTVRIVLWVALLIVLPVPFYLQQWSVIPVGRFFQCLWHGEVFMVSLPLIDRLLLNAQAGLWVGVSGLIAWCYGVWSKTWAYKIRGSIMGLVVLTVLVVFSSIRVYTPLAPRADVSLNFLQIYDRQP